MTKNYLKNKRVTVMGLGIVGGGVGVVKFLVKSGANVLVTDLKTEEHLRESLQKIKKLPVKFVLGEHREKNFIDTDLIIKNPGVPDNSKYLEIAKKNDVKIETDIGMFFEVCDSPIIGVTGTKGKSTVATLIFKLLKSKYSDTVIAGNIGNSPLELIDKINKKTKVALELSSWQLEGLEKHKKSPKIAVITNIYEDHLNRYKNLKDYILAKETIFKFQKANDVLVLNYDDLIVRNFSKTAKSKIYFFSQKELSGNLSAAAFLKNGKIFFGRESKEIFPVKNLRIHGTHNISNVLAAVSVAKICKVSNKNIQKVLKKFRGIPFRQELIKEIRGVGYFNDTTATIPKATEEAIKTFKKRGGSNLILIAGGVDKNLDYRSLTNEIKKSVSCLILLSGTASDKIKKGLCQERFPKDKLFIASSLKKAVEQAAKIARKGDTVIFSPAAASFNLFRNEFDRGNQFNDIVEKLA